MKKAFDDYTVLAGSHRMKGSLWQGPDHLLVIEGRGFLLPYSEHYKRIDYKNVQALTITQTSNWIWINLLLGLLFLFFACIAVLALMNEEGPIGYILMIPSATLLTALIYHLSLGKSCRCALQTAVQIMPLKPLTRFKKAEAVLAKLGQICREHQGEMPAASTLPDEPMPSVMPAHQAAVLPGSKKIWRGSPWVLWTGIFTVLWGGLIAGELFVPGMVYSIIQITIWVPVFVLLLISLVRVSRYVTPGRLTFSLWTAMVFQVVLGIALYVGVIISSVIAEESNEGAQSGRLLIDPLVNLSLDETGMWGLLIILCGVLIMALGLIMVSSGARLVNNLTPSTAAEQMPRPTSVTGTAPPLPTMPPAPVQPHLPPVTSETQNPA